MTAEQLAKIRWLNRVKTAERNVAYCEAVYNRTKENVRSAQQGYRICSSPTLRNTVEKKIDDMLEAERRLSEALDEAEKISAETDCAIRAVQDIQLAGILNARYMLFLTHEQTAEMLHISVKTVKRLHKKALNALQNVPL